MTVSPSRKHEEERYLLGSTWYKVNDRGIVFFWNCLEQEWTSCTMTVDKLRRDGERVG